MDEEELVLGGARQPRRPSRPALLAVLAVVLALGAGFGLGYYTRGGGGAAASAPPSRPGAIVSFASAPPATPSVTPSFAAPPAIEAITDAGSRCSLEHGSSLQVGAQLENVSTHQFVISYVRVLLPLGGLRAAPATPSTCGELGSASPMPGQELDPGGRLWLTTRLTVLTRCPAALPVQFEVHFVDGGQVTIGFADLGGVPYSGCP